MIPLGRFLCWVFRTHQDYAVTWHSSVAVCCLRCGRLR